jgi:hypothetical protein
LTKEQIRIGKVTCNFDLKGWEPANHSLGVMFYTFAFLGAYIGSYLSSGRQKPKVNIYSVRSLIQLVIRNIPNLFIMLITYLDIWKSVSFPVQLAGKFFIPSFFSMLYLYGYSDLLLSKIKMD